MWKQKFKSKIKELCGIDIRSLALFRIGLGIILLADLIIRAHDLTAHYSDMGLLPRDVLMSMIHPANFSLYLMNGTAPFQLFLFLIAFVSALALLFGYFTRLATVCSWLLLISLQIRNPLVLQGGDIVLRLLLFWGMFLPLGACWSLDNKLGRTVRPENQIVSAATLALLLQICFIYWFTAMLKTDNSWRIDGTATWYALSIEQYATSLGHYLLNFPTLLKVGTFFTLYFEAFGPFLAFSPIWTGPLRFATVVLFILFHFILNITMELGVFSYVCSVAWLVFLPGWFWDKLLKFKDDTRVPYKASWLSNALAVFFLSFIFLWNVRTLDKSSSLVPSAFSKIEAIGPLLNIEQYWNMFSPYPIKADGWFIIPGELRDGTKVDLFTDGGPVSWEKPALLSAVYSNDRWRSYMMNLIFEEDSEIALLHFARYLCIHWNQTHPYEKQLVHFKIFFMIKINSLENPPKDYDKTLLWEHHCIVSETD